MNPLSILTGPLLSKILAGVSLALLIACGELDGIVCPPGEKPHVIRGVARKVRHVMSEDKAVDVKANEEVVTRKEAERIQLVVRMLTSDGEITDLV